MGKFIPKADLSNISSGSGESFNREPNMLDRIREDKRDINIQKLQQGKSLRVRLVGGVLPIRMHWIKSLKGNTMPPYYCTKFNPNSSQFDNPYNIYDESGRVVGEEPSDEYRCIWCYLGQKSSKNYFINCIDRKFQRENEDENPVKLLAMKSGMLDGLAETINNAEGIKPNDPDEGYDTIITKSIGDNNIAKYNLTAAIKDAFVPLTKRERKYELFDLSEIYDSIMLPVEELLIQAFRCRMLSYDEAKKIVKHYKNIGAVIQSKYDSTIQSLGNIARKQEEYDKKEGNSETKSIEKTRQIEDDEERPRKRSDTDAFKASEKYSKFNEDDE